MCVRVCACVCAHACARTLELESQAVVSHLTWLLGTKFRYSSKQHVLFIAEPELQPPCPAFMRVLGMKLKSSHLCGGTLRPELSPMSLT